MLAQNFQTPQALGISDIEFESLVKVLGMLERGEIDPRRFSMDTFRSDCGTVGCICGWAYFASNGAAFPEVAASIFERLAPLRARLPVNLQTLFNIGPARQMHLAADTDQAAIALRNYLTTGQPNWAEALAE